MIRSAFQLDWAAFKAIVDSKFLVTQWMDTQNTYFLFATDGIFPIRCDLNRGDPNVTADITDFETNYKANGNKPIARTGFMKKSFSVTTAQTNAAVWTPAAGKRIIVTGYQFSVHNNLVLTTAAMQLFDNTNAQGNIIYSNVNNSGSNYDVSTTLSPPIPLAAADNVLRATTTAAIRVAGVIFGFEV